MNEEASSSSAASATGRFDGLSSGVAGGVFKVLEIQTIGGSRHVFALGSVISRSGRLDHFSGNLPNYAFVLLFVLHSYSSMLST